MRVINPDDILSALWGRLNGDPTFKSMVTTIVKGPKRRIGHTNPTATVHLLTAPVDPELDSIRSTAIVNVYMNDLPNGQMDADGLGKRAERVQHLFHKAHLPTHPEGPLTAPYLRFHTIYVSEPLLLPSDIEGEHLASIRMSLIVSART